MRGLRFLSFCLMGQLLTLMGPQAAAQRKLELGDVHFDNTCRASSQTKIQEGVALLHSFEFEDSKRDFREVEQADPDCSIAAWGVALANTQRRGPNMPKDTLAAGWEELTPWLARPAKTQREKLYISAVKMMYEGYESTSGSLRWQRYIGVMEQLVSSYPNDIDAKMLYALALVWTAPPDSAGTGQRSKALGILTPIFKEFPNNPGAAHYIIHAADTAQLASLALPAARKYALIAPDSPHALHMPSHIFSRLGYWTEVIDSNLASARVAKLWQQEGRDGIFDEQHALNHLEYAYLQRGEDGDAEHAVENISALSIAQEGDPWWKVDAEIYYDLETEKWSDALKLSPPPQSPFEEAFDVFWMHAVSAAHLGDVDTASKELDEFRTSSQAFVKQHGWAELVHLEDLQASAWVLYARGDINSAISTLQAAVQYERANPIYYPDVLPRPSAGMLGDIYLLSHRPKEALSAYEEGLQMAPNRLHLLLGARQAALHIHDQRTAQHYGEQVLRICPRNADRREVKELTVGGSS